MSDINPFSNPCFLKDIKRSFVPTKLFNKNKYNNDIIEVNFKVKNNNIVYINIKLSNGKKFEHVYILKSHDKSNKINNTIDEDIDMTI